MFFWEGAGYGTKSMTVVMVVKVVWSLNWHMDMGVPDNGNSEYRGIRHTRRLFKMAANLHIMSYTYRHTTPISYLHRYIVSLTLCYKYLTL